MLRQDTTDARKSDKVLLVGVSTTGDGHAGVFGRQEGFEAVFVDGLHVRLKRRHGVVEKLLANRLVHDQPGARVVAGSALALLCAHLQPEHRRREEEEARRRREMEEALARTGLPVKVHLGSGNSGAADGSRRLYTGDEAEDEYNEEDEEE